MKTRKKKKKLKKVKKSLTSKLNFRYLTKKVKSNIGRTYKKLSTKTKKIKKQKKTKTFSQLKAEKNLRENILKYKQKEKIAKVQAIKARNQEKSRLKDEELKIKKQELKLKEEELKLKVADQRLKEQAEIRAKLQVEK